MHLQLQRRGHRLPPVSLLPVAGVLWLAAALGPPKAHGSAPAGDSRLAEPAPAHQVGARACAGCHTEILADWAASPHARVDCEQCHGPGSVHTRLPERGTFGGPVPAETCIGCHATGSAATRDPARARHRPAPLRAPVPPAPAPAELELFLMSFCPYGGEAAGEIAALERALGKSLRVQVRYVVRMEGAAAVDPPAADRLLASGGEACVDEGTGGAPEADPTGDPAAGSPEEMAHTRGFSSLHGPSEVLEDLRQIVLADLAPERLLDYIAARAADPDRDWQAAARDLGIDPGPVAARLPAARDRLRSDAERARALGVTASPTVRLNGAPLAGDVVHDAVGRAVCRALVAPPAACAAIPACTRDHDCRDPGRTGMEGRCRNPGRSAAQCEYAPAPPVELHVLNDPECAPCNPTPVVAGARELFPGLTVSAHDVTRGEGRAWIDPLGITSVPAFVFVGAESSAAFPAIAGLLASVKAPPDPEPPAAGRLFDPEVFPGPLFFARPPEPGAIDLFLDATGPATLATLRTLAQLRDSTTTRPSLARARIRVHHVLDFGPAADRSEGALRIVQRGSEAHVVLPGTPELQSRLGPEDLAETRRQACIALHGERAIVEYLMDRARAGEIGAGDWRARAERLGLDPVRIGFCAGSGSADSSLARDRLLAAELHARAPAVLVGNRLRLDGLGPWNVGTFLRALGPIQAHDRGGTTP